MESTDLFGNKTELKDKTKNQNGSFVNNMKLPVHRWFRFSAGYSGRWAERVISKEKKRDDFLVLDPFAGVGTTLLAAQQVGAKSIGIENHSFLTKVGQAKLNWNTDPKKFKDIANFLLEKSDFYKGHDYPFRNKLLEKCFTKENFNDLESLRFAYLDNKSEDKTWDLVWLAITSIIREASHVGTAPWQYVLPNKRKAKQTSTNIAFWNKVQQFVYDMRLLQEVNTSPVANLIKGDCRNKELIEDNSIDFVLTSPPYPNNFDYADATRLELTFWDEIQNWGDLHSHVRKDLITSCAQHSAAEKQDLNKILENKLLFPIKNEIIPICRELEEVRKTKGGKKAYHTMVASYFIGISELWESLAKWVKKDGWVGLVLGDSAPYGVYVPVDKWFGTLALNNGFSEFSFEKFRDRNVKWANRTHKVPLKEGCLWVRK